MTGKIEQGVINTGDEIEIVGGDQKKCGFIRFHQLMQTSQP